MEILNYNKKLKKMKLYLTIILIFLSHLLLSQDTLLVDSSVDEILVEFIDNDNHAIIKEIGVLKNKVRTKTMERFNNPGFSILKVKDVNVAIEKLKKNPKVRFAEPNYTITTDNYPNDPYFTSGQLWGMNNIKAPQVWPVNKGDNNVIVGVIDEGIMYWHEDLCGQIWRNPYELEDGIDNDGNGYIDDIYGWDFKNKNNTIFDGLDNHGTHVAGTIGGKGDNGVGVIGVCPNVTMISAKFLEGSGSTSDAVLAIDYLTDLKIRHNLNIVCTNNSWGGGGYSQALYDAIERSKNADILFIAAAGNASNDNDLIATYPAAYSNDNIITVASITSTEQISSFSNYGKATVDIGAPGSGIWSTIPSVTLTAAYSAYNGTSMATPHVSGAVALYKAANPRVTYSQIKETILNNARPIPSLQGKVLSNGTLDVSKFTQSSIAVNNPRNCVAPPVDTTPPTKPTNLRLTSATNNTLSVAWNRSFDPESGIKHYNVWFRRADDPNTTYGSSTVDTFRTMYALPQDVSVRIWLAARNNYNLITYSDTITAKTTGIRDSIPPTAPINLRVLGMTSTSVNVAWDSSIDNSKVFGYSVWWRLTSSTAWTTANVSCCSRNITGLPVVNHEIKVRAYDDSYNYSQFSPSLFITFSGGDTIPPTAPTNLRVTNTTTTSISVAWNASTDNVGVSGYRLYYRSGNNQYQYFTFSSSTLSYTHSNLTSGTTYTYYVQAFDGTNNFSPSSNVITQSTISPDVTPPTTPTNLRVTGVTLSSVSLAWNASIDNVGVTGYRVFYRTGSGSYLFSNTTGTIFTQNGLSSNTTYEFLVQAYDANGNFSSNSNIVTQITLDSNPCDTIINPPYNVNATPTTSKGKITNIRIDWIGNSQSYDVYRAIVSESNGVFSVRTSVIIGNTTLITFIDGNPPTKQDLERQFGRGKYYIQYRVKSKGTCSENGIISDGSNLIMLK